MFSDPKRKIERYLAKNPQVKSIVVLGSYGRTSAIRALGTVLGVTYTVTVGVNKQAQPDIILLDYRSMSVFPDITPDLAVITSCANEEDAKRFFAVANNSRSVVLNYSDVPQEYAAYLANPNVATYGDELPADYYYENENADLYGFSGSFVDFARKHYPAQIHLLGEHNIRPLTLAFQVAQLFQIPNEKILAAIDSLRPLGGRMYPCRGLQNSIIIDDSADTSETSAYFGLRAIYAIDAPSRIVITDSLSKLGDFDASHIDEVLVLGETTQHQHKNVKISFYDDRTELLNYLGKHFEENGLILLEIPVPEIIEGPLWQ